jgi:hypothetical protein
VLDPRSLAGGPLNGRDALTLPIVHLRLLYATICMGVPCCRQTIVSGQVRGATYMALGMAPLLRRVAAAIALFGAAIGWTSPSNAYVQQLIIDETNTANYNPIPLGSSTPGASSFHCYGEAVRKL